MDEPVNFGIYVCNSTRVVPLYVNYMIEYGSHVTMKVGQMSPKKKTLEEHVEMHNPVNFVPDFIYMHTSICIIIKEPYLSLISLFVISNRK